MNKTRGREFRESIRNKVWAGEDAWTGDNEKGFFQAPRTLPLIMLLISMKKIGTKGNAARVYLELWSRHMGGWRDRNEARGRARLRCWLCRESGNADVAGSHDASRKERFH